MREKETELEHKNMKYGEVRTKKIRKNKQRREKETEKTDEKNKTKK